MSGPQPAATTSELQATLAAHSRHYGALVAQATGWFHGPAQALAIRTVQVEAANIAAALTQARELGEAALLRQFAAALHWLSLVTTDYTQTYRSACELADAAAAIGDNAAESIALSATARLLYFMRRHGEADAVAARALSLAQASGDTEAQAFAQHALGLAARGRDDAAGTRQHFTAALALYEERGDHFGAATLLNNIALTQLYSAQRVEWLKRALELTRRTGNRWTEATVLSNLLTEATAGDDPGLVESYARQCLALGEQLGDRNTQVHTWLHMAHYAIVQGRGDAAYALAHRARDVCLEIGYYYLIPAALSLSSAVLVSRGELGSAAADLLTGLRTEQEIVREARFVLVCLWLLAAAGRETAAVAVIDTIPWLLTAEAEEPFIQYLRERLRPLLAGVYDWPEHTTAQDEIELDPETERRVEQLLKQELAGLI